MSNFCLKLKKKSNEEGYQFLEKYIPKITLYQVLSLIETYLDITIIENAGNKVYNDIIRDSTVVQIIEWMKTRAVNYLDRIVESIDIKEGTIIIIVEDHVRSRWE
ncbi:MAG: hypothetical protein NC489_11575 [Ruminococcus flavefaciens]|nr:hypothetical protein [Ruminococcus flavefaciens]